MWLCTPCLAARSVTHDLVNSSRSFHTDWAGDVILTGSEAMRFAEGLQKVLVNDETWDTVYLGRLPHELWLLSYPDSGHHGGGVPTLARVDVATAGPLLAHHAWTVTDPNLLVEFLVDRWCDRRALGPLRHILGAWPNHGLTDGYGLLRDALAKVRSVSRDVLDPGETELAHLAQNSIERVLHCR